MKGKIGTPMQSKRLLPGGNNELQAFGNSKVWYKQRAVSIQERNQERKQGGQVEFVFALVDAKNGNEILKKSVMSHAEAKKKNRVLRGTGIAWGSVDS